MAFPGAGTFTLPAEPMYHMPMVPGQNPGVMSAPPPYMQPHMQPPAPQLMPPPVRPPGCPPGLEYLAQLEQLLVQQQVDLLEVLSGWEEQNNYLVKNSAGQQVFLAKEVSGMLGRHLHGPTRAFTINLYDNMGQLVLKLLRPLRCTMCCFPCCLQELEVQSPPGNAIGYVQQNWHPLVPKFTVLDERKEPRLKIRGPLCSCPCMSDVVFQVTSPDGGAKVGQISKQWGGMAQEYSTNADNFGISFPQDLDVKLKAVLMGACFLIDFMFFEEKPQKNR